MKFNLTVVILFLLALTGKAQPTINANVLPNIGDTILMSLDSILVPPGASGANITWDFSNSIKQDIFIERVYLDPSKTPYFSQFPNAKICRTDGIGSVYSYWDNSNNTKSIYLGFVEKGIYDQSYNALPINYYRFPINYGNSFVDSISALTNPGGLVGPGKYFFNADAWGTIKLPNKTISNVLRTKSLIYIGDSNPPVNSYSLTTEYTWYQQFKKEPLMVISSVVIDHKLHKKFIIFDNSSKVSINEIHSDNSFEIFPNPAYETLNIKLLNNEVINSVSINDLTGKQLLFEEHFNGKINLNELKKGMYIVLIKTNSDKVFCRKLIKN